MNAAIVAALICLGMLLLLILLTAGAMRANAMGIDRAVAALRFHAIEGEPISLKVAQWQDAGPGHPHYETGCRFCAFLDRWVEVGHCAKQLNPHSPPTPLVSGLRAMFFILAGLVAVLYLMPAMVYLIVLALVRLFI